MEECHAKDTDILGGRTVRNKALILPCLVLDRHGQLVRLAKIHKLNDLVIRQYFLNHIDIQTQNLKHKTRALHLRCSKELMFVKRCVVVHLREAFPMLRLE